MKSIANESSKLHSTYLKVDKKKKLSENIKARKKRKQTLLKYLASAKEKAKSGRSYMSVDTSHGLNVYHFSVILRWLKIYTDIKVTYVKKEGFGYENVKFNWK